MKLRRAMAAAAATAAIAPAALTAAPAAYASADSGSREAEAPVRVGTAPPLSASTSPEPSETAPAGGTGAPEAEDAAAPDGTTRATDAAGAADAAAGTTPKTPPASTGASSTPGTGTPEADATADTPSPDAGTPGTGYEWPVDACEVVGEDEDFTSSLSGLPEEVAAGSGWHPFSLSVRNDSDRDREFSQAHVFLAAASEDGDASRHAALQVRGGDGAWHDVSTDAESAEYGYVGHGTVGAGETVTLQLRLKVGPEAPESVAVLVGYAFYLDDDGETCRDTPVGEVHVVVVVGAGTVPSGKETRPQGGRKKLPAKPGLEQPEKQKDLEFEGELAATGSSSALPMFALAGGAAVALGAGAVFAVRRRRGTGADTSAAA